MTIYIASIQFVSDTGLKHGPAFLTREYRDTCEVLLSGDNKIGTWVTIHFHEDSDVRAAEWLYNLMTRLDMDFAMREGRPARDKPLDEGLVVLNESTGRFVLLAEVGENLDQSWN